MLSDYRAKPTREMTFYKWSRSSGFTAKAKTDSEHDRILKGITDLLYAYEKHCDPSLCSSPGMCSAWSTTGITWNEYEKAICKHEEAKAQRHKVFIYTLHLCAFMPSHLRAFALSCLRAFALSPLKDSDPPELYSDYLQFPWSVSGKFSAGRARAEAGRRYWYCLPGDCFLRRSGRLFFPAG